MTPTTRAPSRALPGTAACVMLAAAAIAAVVFFHYFADQRGDDSYIFFRIADNLAAGRGPVFNPGEHVEAYSSPLWLGVLAVARALGANLVSAARILGWASTLATLALTYRLARLLGASERASALSVLLLTLCGSLWYWAPSGLETPIYVALFVWACCAMMRGFGWEWAVAIALVGVARPEGFVLSLASVAGVWFARRERPRAAVVGLALGIPFAYLAFRLAYFHEPFPNTYYAKATGALGKRLADGFQYAFWPLLVTAACVAIGAWDVYRRRDRAPFVVGAWSLALLAAVVFGGGDWMWGRRLALPAVPVAAALLAWAVRRLTRARAEIVVLIVAGLLLDFDDYPFPDRKDYEKYFGWDAWASLVAQPKHALHLRFGRPIETVASAFAWQTMPEGSRLEGTMIDASREVARYMRAHYPDEPLTAVNHAGAVPYYAGFPVIDMTGLADFHIAHGVSGGLHEKYDAAYVLARQPKLVVLNSRVQPTPEHWYVPGYWDGETALVTNEAFAREYRAVPRFWSWHYADGYTSYILLYERTAE